MDNQDKKKLTWDDFETYLFNLNHVIKENKPDGVVVINRGGLPIGTAISNRYNLDLSIIDYQTRDAKENESKNPILILDKGIADYGTILLIDEIKDSGLTLKDVELMLKKQFPNLNIITDVWIDITKNEHAKGMWFVFPWEEPNDLKRDCTNGYCYYCDKGEVCNKNEIKIHCHKYNKSFDGFHFCEDFS